MSHEELEELVGGLVDEDEADQGGDVDVDEEPQNLYTSVTDFVRDFLVAVYARTVSADRTDFRWCPRWWDHAEAVSRLEALWKAFETLRQDPGTGAAVWWRDYCDPTMAALCASDGPFRQCSEDGHKVQPDLPLVDPPPTFIAFGGGSSLSGPGA